MKYLKASGCGKFEQCDQYKLPDNKVLISFTRPHSAAGHTGDIVNLKHESRIRNNERVIMNLMKQTVQKWPNMNKPLQQKKNLG